MRRPWNITDSSVYSLATYANDGFNMNICTYVTAISMKPKMYAIAIDLRSKTQRILKETDFAILQVLGKSQTDLVRPLGQKSGLSYDKETYLRKHDLIANWNEHSVLKEAAAYMSLQKQGSQITGDHELYWFNVFTSKTNHDNVLSFQNLIVKGLIL